MSYPPEIGRLIIVLRIRVMFCHPSLAERPEAGLQDLAVSTPCMLLNSQFQTISYHLAASAGSGGNAHCTPRSPELVYLSKSSTLLMQLVANELEAELWIIHVVNRGLYFSISS